MAPRVGTAAGAEAATFSFPVAAVAAVGALLPVAVAVSGSVAGDADGGGAVEAACVEVGETVGTSEPPNKGGITGSGVGDNSVVYIVGCSVG